MTDAHEDKRATVNAFGEGAEGYLESETHRRGADLDRVAAWCADAGRALDVATGAGHTAGAIARDGVPDVVAMDASPAMVATAIESVDGVAGVVGDAERLPFSGDSFDAVSCRIAAHHFPEPDAFVAEVARVLRPGGTFAFEDNVVPEDEELGAFLNGLEATRDPTHVESYTTSTWRRWLTDAGFSVVETELRTKRMDFEPWVNRSRSPDREDEATIERRLLEAPPEVVDFLDVRIDRGRVQSFESPKALIRAVLDD